MSTALWTTQPWLMSRTLSICQSRLGSSCHDWSPSQHTLSVLWSVIPSLCLSIHPTRGFNLTAAACALYGFLFVPRYPASWWWRGTDRHLGRLWLVFVVRASQLVRCSTLPDTWSCSSLGDESLYVRFGRVWSLFPCQLSGTLRSIIRNGAFRRPSISVVDTIPFSCSLSKCGRTLATMTWRPVGTRSNLQPGLSSPTSVCLIKYLTWAGWPSIVCSKLVPKARLFLSYQNNATMNEHLSGAPSTYLCVHWSKDIHHSAPGAHAHRDCCVPTVALHRDNHLSVCIFARVDQTDQLHLCSGSIPPRRHPRRLLCSRPHCSKAPKRLSTSLFSISLSKTAWWQGFFVRFPQTLF